MVAGTDAGLAPIKPTDVLRWAVGQMSAHIGMTPAEALRADILAIDGNPLEDPAALHRIQAVYVRGTAIA